VGQVQTLTLDEALALARQNRPAVRAARLRIEQARFQRRSLAAPLPARLDLQATSNRGLYGNDDDVALTQPIDVFGRRTANRSMGDAQVLLAEAGLREALLEIQGDVVTRYAEAVAAGQLVSTARSQLDLAQRFFDATQKRADGGAIPPVQVKRANLEVQRAKQTLAGREAAQVAAGRRFAGALGVSTEKAAVADFPAIMFASADFAVVTKQRADLLTLAAHLSVAQANVGVGQSSFRPELEISLRGSPYSYGPGQPAGLRATLRLPVFDYGRRRNELQAGRSAVEAEGKSLADAMVRAQAEVDAVQVELSAAVAQVGSFEGLRTDTLELVRVSEVGYREGATTLIEVLEATRTLREVEEGLVESRLRVAQAQATYFRTTGTLLGGSVR